MDDLIPVDAETLRAWMVRYITGILDLPAPVATDQIFSEYGLDSVEAVVMAGVMEEEFGVPVDPIQLFEHPSIDQFSTAMAGGMAAGAPAQLAPEPPA